MHSVVLLSCNDVQPPRGTPHPTSHPTLQLGASYRLFLAFEHAPHVNHVNATRGAPEALGLFRKGVSTDGDLPRSLPARAATPTGCVFRLEGRAQRDRWCTQHATVHSAGSAGTCQGHKWVRGRGQSEVRVHSVSGPSALPPLAPSAVLSAAVATYCSSLHGADPRQVVVPHPRTCGPRTACESDDCVRIVRA